MLVGITVTVDFFDGRVKVRNGGLVDIHTRGMVEHSSNMLI